LEVPAAAFLREHLRNSFPEGLKDEFVLPTKNEYLAIRVVLSRVFSPII